MTNFIIVSAIVLVSCFLPEQLYAASPIRLGIYNNEPLVFVDKDGRGQGIFADIIEYIADQEGWRIEYVPGTWNQTLARLEKGEIDILSTIAYSAARDEHFDFTSENLLTNWGQLYTFKGSDIRGITDVAGKKIAILAGDIHHTVFLELLEKFDVECDLIEVDDYQSVLEQVAQQRADGGIVNRMFGMRFSSRYKVEKSGIIFNPITIHYATPEGKNSELLATLDRYIRLLKDDEESVYYRSLDRWLGALSPGREWPSWVPWSLVFISGIMVLLFLGNIVLRNRVRARTEELTCELQRREETERALREANTIINRSPAVAFLWRNSQGWPVEFVSANVVEIFGYSAEEFTSGEVSYLSVIHPDDLERVGNEVATLSSGPEATDFVHEPYRIVTREGRARWLDDRTYIRRDSEGNITHFEGVVVDITESVKTSETLRQNKEKSVRSKKMESLGLLAGGVAHDLNNVLSGIVSYPDLLLLELPEDSRMYRNLLTIKESGDRAAAIVQDLLTVARGVATIKEPLNLNSVINDHLDSPEFQKLKHYHPEVTIATDLDSELLNILGSAVHIRKVVMNLISNGTEAIKGKGSVTVSTKNSYLDSRLHGYVDINVGEYAVLSIADEGSGISSQDLERIFEPFYTKKFMGRSGTGLGLAVVWNVVQDHEGYIDITTDDHGTRFDVYFPVTRDEITKKDIQIPIDNFMGAREKILVIDDVKSQRTITCEMLEVFNYEPQSVASGEAAVKYLRKSSADLIILDMIMEPGINGCETYRRILEVNPHQKAIIVSGYAETQEVKGAQELGAGRFLKKPLTLEKLGLAVKEELAG